MEMYHHGILGQEWGKRNGPPYPLTGGAYSKTEKDKIYKIRSLRKNSIYNKKHFDTVLKKENTTFSTLSYNKDRTKNVDMFYAAHEKLDKHQYNALFNRPVPSPEGQCLKYKIDNKISRDAKIAGEDSSIKEFKKLYSKDRDFYNFVTDPNRMRKHFIEDKYKFKGYREARRALEKIDKGSNNITDKDISNIYRMFNYVIPSDGGGNSKAAKDVANQRSKFFKLMSDAGYDAVLDTNDAIYGAFKATSPVIVFNQSIIIPSDIKRTTIESKRISELAYVGRKALGL